MGKTDTINVMERQKDTESAVVLAITTFADANTARQIGTRMVEAQLAACVNVIPGLESFYRWKGDLEVEGECLALVKTTRDRAGELERWLREHHPYEQPEFLVIPVEGGSAAYLGWVRDTVAPGD